MGERVPERTDTPRTTPVAAIAEARFRHPGYEAFRFIVRETVATKGVLGEAEALVLVSHGVEAAARLVGVSGRTIRRRCEVAGVSVRVLVHRVRLDATSRVFRIPVPTSVVARWLGFTNPDSYRRFVRREMGVSVKQLRRRVRESAVFLVQGDRCEAEAPLYCSKIASLNAGVKDPSIAETAAMRQGQ